MSLSLRVTIVALLCVCCALILGHSPLAAQQSAESGASGPVNEEQAEPNQEDAAANEKKSVNGAGSGPRVLCAFQPLAEENAPPGAGVDDHRCPTSEDHQKVSLGNRVVVRVAGLDTFLTKEKKNRSDLRLFLDGVELTGLHTEAIQEVKGAEGTSDVRFKLDRNAENRGAWRTLLGPFKLRARRVTAGLGFAGKEEFAGLSGVSVSLESVRQKRFIGYLVLLAVVFVIFFVVPMPSGGKLTDSLRDRQAEMPSGGKKPFSLARCQMAWWFFLVIAAYIFLWMVLGDLDTITGSVLILMGIGSGTALGAAMIDAGKKAEKELAMAEVVAAGEKATAMDSTPAEQARLAVAQAKLAQVQGAVKRNRSSVLSDLLSDANGYSFHRFQIAVWTVILGIIFVVSVARELAMPQFSETLLGLMGISSGTYLGFKFPERHE